MHQLPKWREMGANVQPLISPFPSPPDLWDGLGPIGLGRRIGSRCDPFPGWGPPAPIIPTEVCLGALHLCQGARRQTGTIRGFFFLPKC